MAVILCSLQLTNIYIILIVYNQCIHLDISNIIKDIKVFPCMITSDNHIHFHYLTCRKIDKS